ncbi:hypothetical protein GCM10011507_09750 [Edaphobacter acidisoli]|uniref:Uncharacterized protein n=1 Tax=Edaphobacter acidisoli TaxID=2040573 RepID=A0A916RJZ5_9BACT|nr:hypothetical protein GCM10011507_09750 [Edaphobacter acidisoli]
MRAAGGRAAIEDGICGGKGSRAWVPQIASGSFDSAPCGRFAQDDRQKRLQQQLQLRGFYPFALLRVRMTSKDNCKSRFLRYATEWKCQNANASV